MNILNKSKSISTNRQQVRPHRDLAKFANLLQEASADGKIDPKERQGLKKAFSKLEAREKAVAKKMLKKAKNKNQKADGHGDVKKFKAIVKKALEDGKITASEKAEIKQAFSELEPREKKATIKRLAENGHQRLAIALSQGVRAAQD